MQTRIITLICAFLIVMSLNAQNISVASFSLLENDLTANTQGTIVYDQNGDKCALIKVETTQTGFSFDAGSLGVVKIEQKVGEIWVYVPSGVKRLSIFHQQLGNIRDYDLGLSVQKAKTYLLKLTTGTVTTVVQEAVTNQYLMFRVEPANAMVLVNDAVWTVNDGIATKYVPFGVYSYRVMAQDYLDESGVIEVNDPNNRHEVNVSLKSNYASITLNVENDAEIWVNGERKGQCSWTGNLGGGEYIFETRKIGHRTATTRATIDVSAGPRTITLNAPTPVYGKLNVNTQPYDADILIDGVKVGTTPSMIQQVLEGSHQVTVRKDGYQDLTRTITIIEGKTSPMDGTMAVGSQVGSSVHNQDKISASNSDGGNISSFTANGVSFNMIHVEGGTFTMGLTSEIENTNESEKPLHQVTLDSYYIGETEVTQALWKAVMGNNPSSFKGDNLPVVDVSWQDCQKFIRKLNKKTGKNFRLPFEAEWEFAARGGNKSSYLQYSGSTNIDDVAWYDANSGHTIHQIKTKHPNELGIYDMSGNVWEWCQDWYGLYSSISETNPTGPIRGSSRVFRGGSWDGIAWSCRVSCRLSYSPDGRDNFLGLRLVLDDFKSSKKFQGITLKNLSANQLKKYMVKTGVLVSSVEPGSIFAQCGMKEDLVIIKIDDTWVRDKNETSALLDVINLNSENKPSIFITAVDLKGRTCYFEVNL